MNFIAKIMTSIQNNLRPLRIISTARSEILTAMITKAGSVIVFYPEDESKSFFETFRTYEPKYKTLSLNTLSLYAVH
jgi:hypothetical protein